MSWRPLLDGSLAVRAREAVCAIAEALVRDDGPEPGPSYAAGDAGIGLFHGYFAVASGDERSRGLAAERLSRAVAGVAAALPPVGFFTGLSGIAWVNQHLEELLAGGAARDLNEQADELLADVLRASPWRWHYDLMHGLVGIGCYALDHLDDGFRATATEHVLDCLEELAERRDGGLTWLTPPQLIKVPAIRDQHPHGYYNLGLAHGVPGVVAFLARALDEQLGGERVERLLEGAVSWSLANRRPADGGSTFSSLAAADAVSCRSGWCYGDPGVAMALFAAGRAARRPELEREAMEIAHRDCARSLAGSQVVDPMLCHGAAGLGHLYNRLFQATGEAAIGEAARVWFERALEMRRQDEGIAGFGCTWEDGEWHSGPGLLDGASGVGLALLAAISDVEPDWDRPMLLFRPASPRRAPRPT